ncbi:MAG: hypothetical protein AAF501_15950, partial [Pseudomonadota bacterium]
MSTRIRLRNARARAVAGLFLGALTGAQALAAEPAHFTVTDRVVAGNVEPFAATVLAIGNGTDIIRRGSGFEPLIYRDWFIATEDAANRAVGSDLDVSANWTLANGALDGAEVEVLRLADGAFTSVRTDRVAIGGHQIGGWRSAMKAGRIISPKSTGFTFTWDTWNRRGVPYFFSLRAVDRRGRLSERSNSVMAVRPDADPKGRGGKAGLVAFDFPKDPPPGGRLSADLPAPSGLTAKVTADGRLALGWRGSGGAVAGYVLEVAETDPALHRGFGFALEGRDKDPVLQGDLVILRKTIDTFQRDGLVSNRVWNAVAGSRMASTPLVRFEAGESDGRDWRLVRHSPGTAVAQPGETYLEIRLADGITERIGRATDSGTAQQHYPVLIPRTAYRMEVWLKADRNTVVAFRPVGFHAQAAHKIPTRRLEVGTTWRKHTVDFTPRAVNPTAEPGLFVLSATGPVTLGVDNFRIFRADTPYLDLTSEGYDRLRFSGVSALRTHAMVKTRRRSYGLGQLTDPGGLPDGIRGQNSLPQSLQIFDAAGVRPWLQIEPHFGRDEWLGLVEYLAAPFDPARDTATAKPWAAKRHAQGRTTPWLDAFDRLYLEIGNETWNFPFKPWIFHRMFDLKTGENHSRGKVYGMYQTYVSEILRTSPYWTPEVEEKIVTVLGGWEARAIYGAQAAEYAPSAELLTTAPYIGGWEAKAKIPEETPGDFFKMLNHVEQVGRPLAHKHIEAVEKINRGRARPVRLGTYEAGPGYVHIKSKKADISPQQAEMQERVMKSLASGTATLDSFLMRASLGYVLQTFFALDDGTRWSSHAVPHRGGHAYPAW